MRPALTMEPRALLRDLFDAAIAAADPGAAIVKHLPPIPKGRAVVIGMGKAALPMAAAFEANWQGTVEGFVVVPDGQEQLLERLDVIHAGHPLADARSLAAAESALALADKLDADDLLVAMISGGGSALASLPAPGISPGDKLAVLRGLLLGGANITELNCVRKNLSAIKGGRLAQAAAPARVCTFVVSDVPGDDPSVIASGPTVVDRSRPREALDIIERYRIEAPAEVLAHLREPATKAAPQRADNELHVVVSPQIALDAAAARAKSMGLNVLYLGDRIEAESREAAKVMAAIAHQIKRDGRPVAAPCVVLSGGETAVTVRGDGIGGRNAEFALALAIALRGVQGVHALAADTDGIDGAAPVAGAFVDGATVARGPDAQSALDRNDAHTFFARLGDQLITGPTYTNVNDFRAILIT